VPFILNLAVGTAPTPRPEPGILASRGTQGPTPAVAPPATFALVVSPSAGGSSPSPFHGPSATVVHQPAPTAGHADSGVLLHATPQRPAAGTSPSTTPAAASGNGAVAAGAGVIRPLSLAPPPTRASSTPRVGGALAPMDAPSGGGDNPQPVITDNNTSDIIGGPASVSVAPPAGSSLTITNVNWVANGGMVDGLKTPDIGDGTFVYPTDKIAANHSTTLSGYWGPSGGGGDIEADVTWSNGMTNQNSLYVYPTMSGVVTLNTSTLSATTTTILLAAET